MPFRPFRPIRDAARALWAPVARIGRLARKGVTSLRRQARRTTQSLIGQGNRRPIESESLRRTDTRPLTQALPFQQATVQYTGYRSGRASVEVHGYEQVVEWRSRTITGTVDVIRRGRNLDFTDAIVRDIRSRSSGQSVEALALSALRSQDGKLAALVEQYGSITPGIDRATVTDYQVVQYK